MRIQPNPQQSNTDLIKDCLNTGGCTAEESWLKPPDSGMWRDWGIFALKDFTGTIPVWGRSSGLFVGPSQADFISSLPSGSEWEAIEFMHAGDLQEHSVISPTYICMTPPNKQMLP